MPVSIKARVVFPVDRPPIENGAVTIDGMRIVEVGSNARSRDVVDLGSAAILPGLINVHTHLEFSYLEQPLGKPGMSLVEWIRLVIAERGRTDPSKELTVVRGQYESKMSGVTTIADISTGTGDDLGLLIGGTCFHEVIGFSRARAESALKSLVDRIGFHRPANEVHQMGAVYGMQTGISPHAPYTVSQNLLRDLVLRARQHNLPMAMHVAESREEIELLRDGTGPFKDLLEERSMWDNGAISSGSRPLDYLQMLNDAPRALVVHGNYLNNEELTFLAANRERLTLVYCPRTHAYFFHPTYPLSQALAMGVRVALGTDSRASNPDLNLLSEMRFVVESHPTIELHDILRMATLCGAEALGREREIGSLTPGKVANMIAVPLSEHVTSAAEALAEILSSEQPVTDVWFKGRRTTK